MDIYFRDGKLIAESGDVRVYEMHGEQYLEIGKGHTLWADMNEVVEYADQIGDKARGNCLEIGLGLGVASEYILDKPKVKHLTTIEINEDVLEVYRQLNPGIDNKHRIIHGSGQDFLLTTDEKFDFIFLDFWNVVDEDTLPDIKVYVELSRRVLKPNGEVLGWFDPYTPEEFVSEFERIFK